MPERSRDAARRDELLRHCFDLPVSEQYALYRALGERLSEVGHGELQIPRQVRERGEALDAVEAVAQALDLPEGQAPTIEQYEAVREQLGLELSARQVTLRWEGWRFVKLAIAGERPLETPAQRAQRRGLLRADANHDPLTCLQIWFGPPRPPALVRDEYDYWVKVQNAGEPDKRFLTSGGIITNLGLPWSLCVAVALGEQTLTEARAEHMRSLLENSGRLKLASIRVLAARWNVTREAADYRITRDVSFPKTAAVLLDTDVWAYDDIELYEQGKPVTHPEHYLQERIMDAYEVAERLGIKHQSLLTGIRRGNYDFTPKPEGTAGGRHYWMREDFETWLETHPRRGRPLR